MNNFFYTKKVKLGDLPDFNFFSLASLQSDNFLKQARIFDSFLWFHTSFHLGPTSGLAFVASVPVRAERNIRL